MALPKSNRIVKNLDIQNILKKSFTANGDNFKLKFCKNKVSKFRLLVVISKKIAKKANKRNLIKRRIIYIFEKLNSNLKLPNDLDLMITAKNSGVLKLTFEKIVDDILPLYKDGCTKILNLEKK